ncbi:MAG: adenylosuccinate synthase [Fimbriimonadales bacterium]|nr:adenylosuccinate synthase [Fimbriimonadales bacterium]
MPTLIIVGALWGDEAKGKLVDVFGESARFNVRYSGGNNAGHTVKVGSETYKFHLIPSGILHESCTAVLGAGMVICPAALVEELKTFREKSGREGKLLISGAAHVVFPYHRSQDAAEEEMRGDNPLGTTKRGIGPAYQDKVSRIGIRMWEFVDPNRLTSRVKEVVSLKNRTLQAFGEKPIDADAIIAEYCAYADLIRPFVGEAELIVNEAIRRGEKVLFEGAQGTLLDIDMGTYPYVTGSHPTSGGACVGTGLPPTMIDNVLGVCAAYATRVGAGPFPTELHNEIGERIRIQGNEFGTTTGRARRTGWLDLVALRHASRINGFTSLAITRLDVLSGFEEVGLCTSYEVDGHQTDAFPSDTMKLEAAKPLLEMQPGWNENLSNCKTYEELPKEAQRFVDRIEMFTETPVSLISVGPERTETIYLKPSLIWN